MIEKHYGHLFDAHGALHDVLKISGLLGQADVLELGFPSNLGAPFIRAP